MLIEIPESDMKTIRHLYVSGYIQFESVPDAYTLRFIQAEMQPDVPNPTLDMVQLRRIFNCFVDQCNPSVLYNNMSASDLDILRNRIHPRFFAEELSSLRDVLLEYKHIIRWECHYYFLPYLDKSVAKLLVMECLEKYSKSPRTQMDLINKLFKYGFLKSAGGVLTFDDVDGLFTVDTLTSLFVKDSQSYPKFAEGKIYEHFCTIKCLLV